MNRYVLRAAGIALLCASLACASLFSERTTPIADAQTTGSISASLSSPGQCSTLITLRGTESTGSLTVSGTFSGTVAINGIGGDGNTITQIGTTTSAGTTNYNIAGYTQIEACMSLFTSGTANVWLTSSTGILSSSSGGGSSSVTILNNPLIVSGQGTAGTPDTGVLTVQGIAGATAVNVSGSVTVSNFATPPPVPTPIVGAPIAVLVGPASPTTAPGGGNVSCVDVNGNQCVVLPRVPTVISSLIPSATPIAISTGANTNVRFFNATSSNTSFQYCMLYNTGTITLGTTAPLLTIAVPPSGSWAAPIPSGGVNFPTVVWLYCSTTFRGSTASAVNTIEFNVGIGP